MTEKIADRVSEIITSCSPSVLWKLLIFSSLRLPSTSPEIWSDSISKSQGIQGLFMDYLHTSPFSGVLDNSDSFFFDLVITTRIIALNICPPLTQQEEAAGFSMKLLCNMSLLTRPWWLQPYTANNFVKPATKAQPVPYVCTKPSVKSDLSSSTATLPKFFFKLQSLVWTAAVPSSLQFLQFTQMESLHWHVTPFLKQLILNPKLWHLHSRQQFNPQCNCSSFHVLNLKQIYCFRFSTLCFLTHPKLFR